MARAPRKRAPQAVSLDQLQEMYSRCPKRHQLPHAVPGFGSCSPLRCARDVAKKVELDEIARGVQDAREAKKAATESDRTEAKAEASAARVQMQRSMAREIARKRLVPMPEGLTGGDAEAYVERKLVELSVDAVAELEYQVKFLDDDHRRDAAARILDSTGHGKKDRTGAAANLIIIQNVPGGTMPDWLKTPIAGIPATLNPQGHPTIPSLPSASLTSTARPAQPATLAGPPPLAPSAP